ncbi:HD domain-containing protein [Mesorhizobium sp.]|uniref:HD domain-containing protein n=1 Tax=Mesorhizobium sp. TaxID=1871066 RepID=UPI000FE6993B|nr:HD domain-containing protein [Mesorhizobium sp.]RWO58546.1 MAG: HD domain-containing protein [Mesorhizobium sp.]
MPLKRIHEFRDPLHDFIELDRQERALVDSIPFQRLRHINQLALSSLVYPGATHKRFEHSLGVMHLARRVFDIVTDPANIHPKIEHIIPDRQHLPHWRSVLSLAALAHDLGHLPFSHAAEKRLLPKGEDHENLTLDLIECGHLSHVWQIGHPINFKDVQKLAVGQKKLKNVEFTTWESILSEIITGDSFGVDRMDYLLRDSYHSGVSYGKFDHLKLMSSLRILPKESGEDKSQEPTLGVELNGLHSAEAMLLARYFMYEQIYFYPVRRIYDQHLIDFMVSHYGANGYSRDVAFHLSQTDNEVMSAIRSAQLDGRAVGHASAKAILCRGHFRLVYAFNPSDQDVLKRSIEDGKVEVEIDQPFNSPAHQIWKALAKEFGESETKKDLYIQGSSYALFPVIMQDGRIESSITLSPILRNFPLMTVDSVYFSPELAQTARDWITSNRDKVLQGDLT